MAMDVPTAGTAVPLPSPNISRRGTGVESHAVDKHTNPRYAGPRLPLPNRTELGKSLQSSGHYSAVSSDWLQPY